MERIDADAEVRHIGAADDVPGGREFVDVPAPRQALVRDADAERQRQHRELLQVARQAVSGVLGRAQFREIVLAARALDYWITEQQLELGLRGIAVALKDRIGECRGALGIVIQMQTMSRDQMVERLLPLLRDAANMLRPLV